MHHISRLHHISQETADFSHLDSIENALNGGVKWTQLRIKNKPESEIRKIASMAKELCKKHKATLIINDYPEICLDLDLDGVHLGLTDTSTAKARELLGPNKIIGGTCNTMDDIIDHHKNGVNYVGLGPFRFTSTKEKLSPTIGLMGYQKLVKELNEKGIDLPIIGIGGIKQTDIISIRQTGIYGVAIASLINLDPQPENVIQDLIKNLQA